MAEWLYEAGIGENRAALVDGGTIVEAAIELPAPLRAGTVAEARLTTILIPGRRGIVRLADGAEALLEPLPARLTEGGTTRVEIVREAIAEPGRPKLARCRVGKGSLREGPALRDRIAAATVTELRAEGPDRLEEAGWSELLEEARTGEIPFTGGALRMSLTPAMTLFDVDGYLPIEELAVAGAAAAGRAIRRLGLAGSIGIDLPTLASRAQRQAAAAALDATVPQPFERTGVNGFGFLQLVRRKERASLPELIQADRAGAAARALLRAAERARGAGMRTIVAAPPVIAALEARPDWLAALERRIGAPVALESDSVLRLDTGRVDVHPG